MTADIHALSGAYALDALPDDERSAFEAHLAQCEPCRTEVRELQETATRLAEGTELAPPPHLRERVMTAVARTRQDSPLDAAAAPVKRS